MNKTYLLKDAIVYNATGKKYNAIAMPATEKEITQHKRFFGFKFYELNDGFIVYKIVSENDTELILGLVSFKPSIGVLILGNIETNKINRGDTPLYSGIGKAMVALACKISFYLDFDGYITFEAKNNLMPFYKKLGAVNYGGLRMGIEEDAAKNLVACYS